MSDAHGLRWVDDALATTQESVLAALDAYPARRVTLLLGGRDRGQPVDRLAAALHARPDVRVLLLGETSERFGATLAAAGVKTTSVGTVEAAVQAVTDVEPTRSSTGTDRDVVLLSPGAASYDQFRDHAAKGAAFAAAIAALAAF